MQRHGKPIQMSNVERAKVGVEGIVQKRVINGEVDRRTSLWAGRFGNRGASYALAGSALAGDFGGIFGRIWKGSLRIGRVGVRGYVQAVYGQC
jgi:hypothetical protein